MAEFDREENRNLQSPDYIQTKQLKSGAIKELRGLEPRFVKQVEKYNLDDPELPPQLRSMFVLEDKKPGMKVADQIHHINPVRTFNGLYANTDKKGRQQLMDKLHSGDHIANTVVMPQLAHQGVKGLMDAVHSEMRARGVEFGAKADVLHPVLQEIDLAHDAPIEYKLHLADRYNKEVRPIVNEILDDCVQNYEDIVSSVVDDAVHDIDAATKILKENQLFSSLTKTQIAKERAHQHLIRRS